FLHVIGGPWLTNRAAHASIGLVGGSRWWPKIEAARNCSEHRDQQAAGPPWKHVEIHMRHHADPYLYANWLIEPMSLDVLVLSGIGADGKPVTFRDSTPNPEERLARSEAETAVHNFIETLNARDQNLIERIFWNGARQADVARAFSVSNVAI